jgi:hypothetical protein
LHDETSEILGKIKENMKTGFRFQALRGEILNKLKTKAAPTPNLHPVTIGVLIGVESSI